MRELSNPEKEKLFAGLYWDTTVNIDDVIALLDADFEGERGVEKINLCHRLLKSYDWYTLLKLVPLNKLKEVLSDAVIQRLHPQSLKARYEYARSVLSK